MKNFIIDIKIFVCAAFLGYAFWRVRFSDGSLSKLVSYKDAVNLYVHGVQDELSPVSGKHIFVDYHYAKRFFD